MRELVSALPLVHRLGLLNALHVAKHRVLSHAGIYDRLRFQDPRPPGAFYQHLPDGGSPVSGVVKLFGWFEQSTDHTPDWHRDPFSGHTLPPQRQWAQVLKNLPPDTDLKRYWEWSRFHWLPQFAAEAATGSGEAAARLEDWLTDWIAKNPPYLGVNWTCGHEAALRVLHLAQAAMLLHRSDPLPLSPPLGWLLRMHLRRIQRTIAYGIAQQNNHGTTEAAGLIVAASWLFNSTGKPEYNRTLQRGRRLFEKHILLRFQEDGTSNQYSTAYHRSVLEVCSFVQLWARKTGTPALSPRAQRRISLGTEALRQLLDEKTGEVPNLGANDGSRVLSLPGEEVSYFLPAVELASAVFENKKPFSRLRSGRLDAYGLSLPQQTAASQRSLTLDAGGIHILRMRGSTAFMRYPRFRFRPSQADALHVDLWVSGKNLLRDAGTYVYADPAEDAFWFSGTGAHNTVQFDGRDQMPRLGNFLFGAWLQATDVLSASKIGDGIHAAAAYRDYRGAKHHRTICLERGRFTCTDRLSGNAQTAVLRWRLAPGEWCADGGSVSCGDVRLRVSVDGTDAAVRLSDSWESRLYLSRSRVPVAEVQLVVPKVVQTVIEFGRASH